MPSGEYHDEVQTALGGVRVFCCVWPARPLARSPAAPAQPARGATSTWASPVCPAPAPAPAHSRSPPPFPQSPAWPAAVPIQHQHLITLPTSTTDERRPATTPATSTSIVSVADPTFTTANHLVPRLRPIHFVHAVRPVGSFPRPQPVVTTVFRLCPRDAARNTTAIPSDPIRLLLISPIIAHSESPNGERE